MFVILTSLDVIFSIR